MRHIILTASLFATLGLSAQNEVRDVPDTLYWQHGDSTMSEVIVTAKRPELREPKIYFNIDRQQMALQSASHQMPQGLNLLGVIPYVLHKLGIKFKSPAKRRRERVRRNVEAAYPD